MAEPVRVADVAGGVSALDAADWDALAGDDDPFLSHRFLSLLERSGSVGPDTGWQAVPLLLSGGDGRAAGFLPAYVKGHSQGEYIFDHSWADAWEGAGGRYYPKLQIAVPFTPVPGRRVLARDGGAAQALLRGAEALVAQQGWSSAHATFVAPDQLDWFREAGWLVRQDIQFHFTNPGYRDFGDFLDSLSSARRKQMKKERARACAGLAIRNLTSSDLTGAHWDAMWHFYQDTGVRKWGRPYLTRAAFTMLAEQMADDIILTLAFDGVRAIAGAMHFVGRNTLYGRYWGAVEDRPFLHFELCYYQAIELAIARGLRTVQAGAQGGHKLARGYAPVATWSAHFIPNAGFRAAVADFLDREGAAGQAQLAWLGERMPFRKA